MNKRILIAAAVVVVLGIQIALAAFFWSTARVSDETAAEPAAATEKKALYHSLRPPFVVTLPYGQRQFMLQADLAVMAHEPGAIEAVIRHAPLLRAEIIDYFTDLEPERIQSRDGKQEILDGLEQLINGALKREAESAAIDAVLFNNLVMQ